MKLLRQKWVCLSSDVKRQHGFTLVELMIALTISLILLLVIGTVFTSSRQVFNVQEDNARIQENGRFALEVLGRSIKQAGYTNIPFSGTKIFFTGVPVTGTDGGGGAPDTITIQYDGAVLDRDCGVGTPLTAADVVAGNNIIQNHFNLDVANAQLRCEGSAAAAPPAPGASPSGQVLLEDIEDLQVLYGIDTTADQSANQYVAVPGDWNQVVTARVCVLIRSARTNVASANSSYINCNGDPVGVLADRRLRRAFAETFNLRTRINILP